MVKVDSERALLTLGGSCGEQTEDDLEQSPVYSDEVRAPSNIELKHKLKEDERSVELQLRADMMLCLARELEKMVQ